MATMIEVPDELKPLVAPINRFLQGVTRRRARLAETERSVAYADVTRAIAEDVMAMERAAHGVILQALDIDEPHLMIDGKLHAQVLRSSAPYFTMAGRCDVERALYRPVGACTS